MKQTNFSALLGSFLLPVTLLMATSVSAEALRARLNGLQEVPAVISPGLGVLRLRIDSTESSIEYRLRYSELAGLVSQAHIHLAQRGANGGVAAFLCTNLGNGPAGTPTCPEDGPVSGTITANNVVGPGGQGIAAGDLDRLIEAIRSSVTYVNVHTDVFPSGEIRGQIRHRIDD